MKDKTDELKKHPQKGRCGYKRGQIAVNEFELRRKIDSLDLRPIGFKLMHSEDGDSWSREKWKEMEVIYRNFLFISGLGESMVPTLDLDKVWHTHILDTQKYAEDCQKVFGYFLHHFPYLGLRGEEDKRHADEIFANGLNLYKQMFGVDITATAGTCQSWCSRKGIPAKMGTCQSHCSRNVEIVEAKAKCHTGCWKGNVDAIDMAIRPY